MGFLTEKSRMASEAGRGRLKAGTSRLRMSRKNMSQNPDKVTEYIQEVNDNAAWSYFPRRSTGRVTQFKPRKNYDFMSDPWLGWKGIIEGGLELVELQVNPHAMLIEPFVRDLADEMRLRIRNPEDAMVS